MLRRDRGFLLDTIDSLEHLPRTPEHRIVLAEAEFRLAIATDTPADEAIERLRRAIEHDPFPAKAHLHLGRLLHRAGRQRAALVAYRQAIRLAPDSRRAHLLLALALLDLGRPEREAGRRLLDALAVDQPTGPALATVDALLASPCDRSGPLGGTSPATPPAGGSAPDTWRAALIDQLARPISNRRQVDAHLAAARRASEADPAAFATACVLLLVGGEAARSVRQLADAAHLDRRPDHPAVVMLAAAVDLAETENPATLVRSVSRAVRHNAVPPELACWLYFARHRAAPPPIAIAVRSLDSLPEQIRALECFVELRIAIVDDCARRAWRENRLAIARLLWHEARRLAPHRVPVAVNLALLAARAGAAEEYRAAWDHLAEVLYVNSAAVGDIHLDLDDRVNLHLALSQQSLSRHRASAPQREQLSHDELVAWVADPDTVEVWLREWDLYYLNSRLRFRTAVHLLGTPRDATAETLTEAHDVLVRHLDTALAAQCWNGVRVFVDLAKTRAGDALREALSQADSAPDPNHDTEQAAADALAEEVFQRILILRRLNRYLVACKSASFLALGAAIATRLFALPLSTVQQMCHDRGIIDADETLRGIFATDLTAITACWITPRPDGSAAYADRVAALERCVEAAPHLVAVRAQRCSALLAAGRPADAYHAAVETLFLPPSPDEPAADHERHRACLVTLLDDIGRAALPDAVRRGGIAGPLAPVYIEKVHQVVRRYPRSGAARLALARMLRDAGDSRAAVAVLRDGVRLAVTEAQRRSFEDQL